MSKTWKDRLIAFALSILLLAAGVMFGRWSNKKDEIQVELKEKLKIDIKTEIKQEIQSELDSKVGRPEFEEFKNTIKTDVGEIKDDQKYIRDKVDDIYTLIFELK